MKKDLRHTVIGSRRRAYSRYMSIKHRCLVSNTARNKTYRGMEFSLDKETFIKWFMENDFKGCSVDRINNKLGYIHSNLQIIPLIDNMIKDRTSFKGNQGTCGKCKTVKTITEFGKDKRRVIGFNNICKTCDNNRPPRKRKKQYRGINVYMV